MNFKVIELKGPETEWVVASTFEEGVEFAESEIDDMSEGLFSGDYVARELSEEEVKELEVRVEDDPDRYEKVIGFVENEIKLGQSLPFHLMATYA